MRTYDHETRYRVIDINTHECVEIFSTEDLAWLHVSQLVRREIADAECEFVQSDPLAHEHYTVCVA